MRTPPLHSAVGVFRNPLQAEQACDELWRMGFDKVEILAPTFGSHSNRVAAGSWFCVALGALLGAMALAGTHLGTRLPEGGPGVPGLLLAGGLLGAAVGGCAAGLGSALASREETRLPPAWDPHPGQTIVRVNDFARHAEAETILRRFGATEGNAGIPSGLDYVI